MLLAVSLGVLVVLLLLGSILVFPRLLAPGLSDEALEAVEDDKERIRLQGDRLKLQNDVRTALLQGLGGAALLVGLLFTWVQLQANQSQFTEQQDLTRRGQIADRFTKAVEQLGGDRIDVRLGGIYGLEQIARDSRDDRTRVAVYEVLTAYIREHAAWAPNTDTSADTPEPKARAPDVQAVLTVLGRRLASPSDPSLDLHNVDLHRAALGSAHLERADLIFSHLEGADLIDTHLERAVLFGAHLERADLYGAHLERAVLFGAHLEGTVLRDTGLRGALADRNTTWPPGFDWRKAGVATSG